MGTRNHGNVVYLLLVLVISLLLSKGSAWFHYNNVWVHVKNDIEGYEVSLDMHCKSNDDDLGLRTLRVGEEWYWEFRQSLIKNTHFWCDFRWYDNRDYRWYEGTFDVYKGNGWIDKYHYLCLNDCKYSVRRDGLYLFREDKYEYEKRGTWH
ncbi:hypothetical protein MKX01_031665 [Papaver californicum]|nr:hypothetical protein MKX01_031665 [Papaver californicum]